MSIALMSAVWSLPTASSTEKLVLLALADNANDQGFCWPSVPTLAKKCGLTRRGVQLQIRALEKKKWIKTSVEPGRSSSYHVTLPDPRTVFAPPANGIRPPRERYSPPPANGIRPNHQYEPSLNRRPLGKLSVLDLKTIIATKEEQCAQLKSRYATEGPLTTDWSSDDARKEFRTIRADIKNLKYQISQFA